MLGVLLLELDEVAELLLLVWLLLLSFSLAMPGRSRK